jgi:hypothetical protein
MPGGEPRLNPVNVETLVLEKVLGSIFANLCKYKNARLLGNFSGAIKRDEPANLTITLFLHFSRQQSELKTPKPTKMKFLIVFALCFVAALAAPTGDVTVLKNDFSNDGTAGYNFA